MGYGRRCLFCELHISYVECTDESAEVIESIPFLLNFHPLNDLLSWKCNSPKAKLCIVCYEIAAEGHQLLGSLQKIQKKLNYISVQLTNVIKTSNQRTYGRTNENSENSLTKPNTGATLRQELINFIQRKNSSCSSQNELLIHDPDGIIPDVGGTEIKNFHPTLTDPYSSVTDPSSSNDTFMDLDPLHENSEQQGSSDSANTILLPKIPGYDPENLSFVNNHTSSPSSDIFVEDILTEYRFDLDENELKSDQLGTFSQPRLPQVMPPPVNDEHSLSNAFGVKECTITLFRCDEKIPVLSNVGPLQKSLKHVTNLRRKEQHVEETKPKKRNRQPYYACAECPEVFQTLKLRTTHIRQKHIGLRCPINDCARHFLTTRPLEYHIRDDHDIEFEHFCNFESCGLGFYTQIGLQAHQKNNHDESKTFQCDLCPSQFSTTGRLMHHKGYHRGTEYKFLCDKCTYGTNHKSHLEYHQAKEHNQFMSRHTCPHCSFGSVSKGTLQRHIMGHLEPGKNPFRKYACPQAGCTSRFDRPSLLTIHIQSVHQTERNFQCDRCPASFKTKGSLAMHLRIHDGLENYPCPHCSKILAGKQKLKIHIRVLHEPEHAHRIKCEDCGAGFPIRKYLLRHRKICAEGYSGTAKKTTLKIIEARRRRSK